MYDNLQTWYGRSERGSQVFEDCSRSIYICEGKFGGPLKLLKASIWQMQVTRTVHIMLLGFILQFNINNLFSSSTWWKLIDHIFCGIYVIHINDVSDSFVYKICSIDMNDVNNMLIVHALNRMIWLDDSLTIQRMQ